jgi:hypothetical protein
MRIGARRGVLERGAVVYLFHRGLRGMASVRKVYDFSMDKVEHTLVGFLARRENESTVADMIAGTGLPKYQVEQGMKLVLSEYDGRLKATESGELLYSFPGGMRNTTRGFVPGLKRFWRSFSKGAARVLSLLFKIWIVVMLVGYFVVFLALMIVAIVGAFAASAAGRGDRDGRSRRGGDGFGAMFLVVRLFDLALRMWIMSSILQGPRKPKAGGRPFYKSVFGFIFGEGDPNPGWDEAEKQAVIAYIRGKRGVVTVEELMALTGMEEPEAQRLVSRYLLEFEGEPGVTEGGTVIFSFPALLRTTEREQKGFAAGAVPAGRAKRTAAFSANKRKTNGWILFFNTFNLAFGTFFLSFALTHGSTVVALGGRGRQSADLLSVLYAVTYNLLASAGISPVPFIATVLGIVPVAFSVFFFFIPLFRKIRLDRENERIREENLRKRVYAAIIASPADVDPRSISPGGADSSPKAVEKVRARIVERFAALKSAEPVRQPDGSFRYRFAELERQAADLDAHRKKVDLKSFEVGKTVFDSGQ